MVKPSQMLIPSLALICSVEATAQTAQRAETIIPARLAVTGKCPMTGPTIEPAPEAFFAAVLAPFLAGLAGDVASAGVSALAGALEEASKERAIGARGVTTFNFYRQLTSNDAYSFRNRLRPGEASCLVMSVDDDAGGAWTMGEIPSVNDVTEANKASALEALTNAGITVLPKLYVEVEIVSSKDGFVAQPVLIWYRSPFKGASRRGAMPTELHLTFATPDTTKLEGGAGAPFAVARIALPAVAAGGQSASNGLYDRYALRNIGSALLPLRPETGGATAKKTAATTAFAARDQARQELRDLEEQINNPKKYGLKPAQVAAFKIQRSKKIYDISKLDAAATAAGADQELGGTTVEARFLLIKNPNRFGAAIATALKTRSTALGTALTQELTPKPAWSDAETQYVAAMLTVREKQAAYDTALAAGDSTKILAAEVELKNAQAQANAKAVAAGKPVPFPSIL